MPIAHSILNMLVFSFVLTSGLVQGYECQRALGEYFMSWQSYQARSRDLLNQGRELSYDDVKDLFMPSCDLYGDFVMKQCFMNSYCWCSDSEGNLVSGTFKKGKEEDIECGKLYQFYHVHKRSRRNQLYLLFYYSKMHGGKPVLQDW